MGMGVDPLKWGPGAWRFLHYATLTFPDAPTAGQRRAWSALFRLLPGVLPCSRCRTHLRKTYERMPPRLKSRGSMIRWLGDVHTATNADLHKRVRRVPVQSRLGSFRAGWRTGLRDLCFSIAFNAPRSKIPEDVRRFLAACRRVTGEPVVGGASSKAGLLNALCRHYRVGKAAVRSRYGPWLSDRSRGSSGRAWPSIASRSKPRRSAGRRSRRSRQPVLRLKIGL